MVQVTRFKQLPGAEGRDELRGNICHYSTSSLSRLPPSQRLARSTPSAAGFFSFNTGESPGVQQIGVKAGNSGKFLWKTALCARYISGGAFLLNSGVPPLARKMFNEWGLGVLAPEPGRAGQSRPERSGQRPKVSAAK